MVHVGVHVSQLDEVLEIDKRGLAAPALQVCDEGRAIDGGKAEVFAADDDVILGVARQLGEGAGRLGNLFLDESGIEINGLAAHVGAVLAQNGKRLVIVEVDADVGKDIHRRLVNLFQLLFVQHFVGPEAILRLCRRGNGCLAHLLAALPAPSSGPLSTHVASLLRLSFA